VHNLVARRNSQYTEWWKPTLHKSLTEMSYFGSHMHMLGREQGYHYRKMKVRHSKREFSEPEIVSMCMSHSMSLQKTRVMLRI